MESQVVGYHGRSENVINLMGIFISLEMVHDDLKKSVSSIR